MQVPEVHRCNGCYLTVVDYARFVKHCLFQQYHTTSDDSENKKYRRRILQRDSVSGEILARGYVAQTA